MGFTDDSVVKSLLAITGDAEMVRDSISPGKILRRRKWVNSIGILALETSHRESESDDHSPWEGKRVR